MEEHFCSRHEDIEKMYKTWKENKKFFKRLFGSKWSYIFLPLLFCAILTWVGWVSREIYAKEVVKEKIATICKEVQEIKTDNRIRDEKREAEKREEQLRREKEREEQVKRDREYMKILLDIQKQIRK